MKLPTETLFATLEKLCRGRPATLKKEIYLIRDWLTKERWTRPQGYMSKAAAFSAYMAYHLPIHLPETFWILDQAFSKGGLPRIEKVLDLGAGPGTATLSLLLWLKAKELRDVKEITLVDQSGRALDAAETLVKTISPEPKINRVRAYFDGLDARTITGDMDFVICSHVLNEFGNGPRYRERKYEFIKKSMKALKSGRTAIFIEPPLREPTLDIMWIRDQIVQENEFTIKAPCPKGIVQCTMAAERLGWCYAQAPRIWTKAWGLNPWDKEIEKTFGIVLNHPGFSYLVLMNEAPKEENIEPHAIAITDPKSPDHLLCTSEGARQSESPYRGAYIRSLSSLKLRPLGRRRPSYGGSSESS